MGDVDDFELIRRYADEGSEAAFGELVRRHIGLVYSSALRQMHDVHDAEDVTQAVFILLARNAAKLNWKHAKLVLGGWLVTTTRYVASNARRSASRRRTHERRAAELAAESATAQSAGQADAMTRAGTDPMTDATKPNSVNAMNGVNSAGDVNLESEPADRARWERIAPELDEALAELSPRSRDAVVLRYFQGKSVRETAAALGISEDAAKRRLSRALGQLRALFGRRGIAVSGFALGAVLSSHAVHAAPAALVAATTTVSLQSATAAALTSHAAHLAAQKGAMALMTLIKSKVTFGLMLLAIGGTTAAVAFRAFATPPQAAPGAGPPSVPAGGGHAGAPPAKGDDSWRKRFDEVYRLDEGQVLRHIPPPVLLERTAYIRSLGTFIDLTEDGLFVFAWRDGHAEFDNWSLGVPTVSSVLGTLVGLPSFKLEMKLKDRLRSWPGDWVVRKDVPEDKKMDALAKALHDELQWKAHFEKRDAEHDVVVVTGTFTAPKDHPDGLVDVFVDARTEHNGNAGDLSRFVTALGELCNTETINEANGAKDGLFWRVHTGGNLTKDDADKVLANVAAQTGLHFARARRVTSHWVTVRDEKAEK